MQTHPRMSFNHGCLPDLRRAHPPGHPGPWAGACLAWACSGRSNVRRAARGTTGVALMLILAAIDESAATLDTALVLAVLAPVLAVAFVAARRHPDPGSGDNG